MKSFEERYKDEVLTDNTQIEYCLQCEDCIFWGNDDDPFSNEYSKTSCDMYPFPEVKPDYVRDNTGQCEFKETL